MFRFVFRLLGFLALAGGFAALVIDGTRSLAANALQLTQSGAALIWALGEPKFLVLQEALQTKLPDFLLHWLNNGLLALPVWVVLGGFGLTLLIVSRRRAATIGHSSR